MTLSSPELLPDRRASPLRGCGFKRAPSRVTDEPVPGPLCGLEREFALVAASHDGPGARSAPGDAGL